MQKIILSLLALPVGLVIVVGLSIAGINLLGEELFVKVAWLLGGLFVVGFIALRKRQIVGDFKEKKEFIEKGVSSIRRLFKNKDIWLYIFWAVCLATLILWRTSDSFVPNKSVESSDYWDSCAPRC